jgi:hypothetical protein
MAGPDDPGQTLGIEVDEVTGPPYEPRQIGN